MDLTCAMCQIKQTRGRRSLKKENKEKLKANGDLSFSCSTLFFARPILSSSTSTLTLTVTVTEVEDEGRKRKEAWVGL